MNTNPTRQFIVARSIDISRRGAVAFFEGDPAAILPLGPAHVRVSTPAGYTFNVDASIEAARKVPPGEVLAMLFPSLKSDELPAGSVVVLVDA